jgi:hypothetical protein
MCSPFHLRVTVSNAISLIPAAICGEAISFEDFHPLSTRAEQ